MKLNISQRDKSLLIIIAGILIAFLSFYLGYRNFRSETEKIKVQNETLDTQIAVLEDLADLEDEYIAETKELEKVNEEIIQKFPANIIAEDVVLYIRGLEQETESYVSSITIPERVHVSIQAPVETYMLNAANDITGVIAENSFVNDGTVPDTRNMDFSYIESDISYSITYNGLKEMIQSIAEDKDRKNVDNISLVFNENTGNLSGSMTVNYFVLSGTGKEYLQPEVSSSLKGVDNIFGTLNDNLNNTLNDDSQAE